MNTIVLTVILMATSERYFSGEANLYLPFNTAIKRVEYGNFILNQIMIKFENSSSNTFSFVSLEYRFSFSPHIESYVDLFQSHLYSRNSLYINEAYLTQSKFIVDNIDLSFGKKRVAWGRAYKINPVDFVNPPDFSNFLEFGEKVPNVNLDVVYYINDFFNIEICAIPLFSPALVPEDTTFMKFRYSGKIITPEPEVMNTQVAARISGNIIGIDVGITGFRGFEKLPLPVAAGFGITDTFGFNRTKAAGIDFAGEFKKIGFWFEGALNVPDEFKTRLYIPVFENGNLVIVTRDTVASKDPYIRVTTGIDYTFKRNWYVNAQYIHGMDFERKLKLGTETEKTPGDYLMTRIEKRFPLLSLKFSVTGIMEHRSQSTTWIVLPQVEYNTGENTYITISYMTAFGSDLNYFSSIKTVKPFIAQFRFFF